MWASMRPKGLSLNASLCRTCLCDRRSPLQAVLAKYNVNATDTTTFQMSRAFVVRALQNWSKLDLAQQLCYQR